MRCPFCKSDTRVTNTQTDYSDHPLPDAFKGLGIVRRKRVCIKDGDHKFWSIEAPEDIWNQPIERGTI